jgi:hypothetical protein
MSILHQFPEPNFRNFDIGLGRALRPLWERMHDDNRIGKPGGIQRTIDSGVVLYSNLLDAPANGRHRLEVVGLQAALYFVELVAGVVACAHWEIAQALQRVPQKPHWLHRSIILVRI